MSIETYGIIATTVLASLEMIVIYKLIRHVRNLDKHSKKMDKHVEKLDTHGDLMESHLEKILEQMNTA